MKKYFYLLATLLLVFSTNLSAQGTCNAKFSYYLYSSYNFHFYPLHTDSFATYSWNFGDSTTSTDEYAKHTFKHSGRFHVCLTISDTVHKCSNTYCDSVSVSASSACNAAFTMYKDSSGAVHYSPSVTTYTYYTWNYGDTTTGSGISPVHTYKHSGVHYVCLYVSDTTAGCVNSWCDTVSTKAGSGTKVTCSAKFAFYVYGKRELHFYPTSTASYTSYSWTFSDTTTSSSKYPLHTFTHNGRFKVCLTVTDSINHCSDSWCDSVTISTSCSAAFTTYKDTSGNIHFTPSIKTYHSYYWAFGDSTTSTDIYPHHTYKYAGLHHPCLYVSDTSIGCSSSWCDTVSTKAGSGTKVTCSAKFAFYVYGKRELHFYPTSTASYTYYSWTFSDTTTSSTKYPLHTFTHNSRFKVCLTVADSINHCSDSWCDSVTINTSCSAAFKLYKDTSGTVHFGPGTATYSSYYWAFGDSTTSTDIYPHHTYKYAGLHHPCLYVSDTSTGCSSSWCDTVSTKAGSGTKVTCSAKFAFYVYGTRQLHFYPTSTASYTSYSWTFSDTTTSSAKYPIHSFTHNGRFKVCLTVVDSINHCSDSWCDSVTISTSCSAAFTTYKDTLGNIHFTPSVKTYHSYYWAFGDSTTSTDISPTHTYKHAGKHLACLYINDTSTGCSAHSCDTVSSGTITPCVVSFVIDSIDTLRHTIHISNTSTGYTWHEWIFGDSTYSSLDTTTHHYKKGGAHYICLYIKCINGTYTSYCLHINGDTAYAKGSKHGGLFSIIVSKSTASGVTEIKSNGSLQVYPNPVSNILTLKTPANFDKGVIVVRDIMGREIFAEDLTLNSDARIDTHSWPAGIYILQLTGSQGTFSTRIIKQ